MYKILRNLLFLLPAEGAHHFSMNVMKWVCATGIGKRVLSSAFTRLDPALEKELFGLRFRNPVGLGAGFDKNAKYLRELEVLGFGFVEIGTVTPRPQAGNEKPRLFRLPKDKALINRMGFNNEGVEVVSRRLKKWKEKSSGQKTSPRLVIGGNIGKNKTTPNEEAWKDYETCFTALHGLVDFFVVNVSSPNTPGLRELQEKDALKKILTHLQDLNKNYPVKKPILLKIAPDLSDSQINDVIDLAREIRLDGLVATNTTISREGLTTSPDEVAMIGPGGLSGKPLEKRSTEVIRYIHQRVNGSLPLLASGGIFTGEDAVRKLENGATLIEVWTGFIYEGPKIVKNICSQLV